MIVDNIPLVTRIAKNIGGRVPPCYDLSDLEGPGMIGLVEAGRRFVLKAPADDHRPRSERFVAFARAWIEGSIKQSIRRGAWREHHLPHLEDTEHFDVADTRPGPHQLLLAKEVSREIDHALNVLDDRSKKVIEIHYRGQKRLRDASVAIGTTPSRASQIHCISLKKLAPRLKLVA